MRRSAAPRLARLLRGVLALPLLVGAPAFADPAPPSPSPPAIDEAIARGVDYVVGEQRPDGTWGGARRAVGHTALAVYALLHSGIDETAEGRAGRAFQRAVRWLDGHGPGTSRAGDREAGTYETALLVLILRERGQTAAPRLRRLVALLERTQAENGQWTYGGRPDGRRPPSGDNSNSQFAVLALGAAVGEGAEVDPETLRRAWAWWRRAAQRDGGFGYASGGSLASASTGSMTAAGIASLAILEAALGGRPADGEGPASAALDDALERLARGFAVDHNFGPAPSGVGQRQRKAGRGWQHYYLWSVERAMVLAGRERLDGRDWYAEGAAHLLASQKKDGSWRGEHPLYATCFALLFLTRAADPPRVFTAPERPRGPATAPAGPAPGPAPESEPLPEGDVLEWLERGLAPATLRRACLQRGAASLEVLVRALGRPDPKVRQRANETLRALLGDERVGRADRHPLARGRLRLWVRRMARHLRPRDGRFVLD